VAESGQEYHYPGTNFLGPGTHIKEKLESGVLPTSPTDFKAFIHDISYQQEDHDKADDAFLHNDKFNMLSTQNFIANLGIMTNKTLRSVGLDVSRSH
jgi:hypothetical protein